MSFVSFGPIPGFARKHATALSELNFDKRINRLTLYYFSKKKEFIIAMPSGTGFVIKGDADLQMYLNEMM